MAHIVYIILRLFTIRKEMRVEGDEARHLKTARTFYKMWNNDWYDFHPPLYSLLIRIFSIVMPDVYAGILVSFLSSVGLLWVVSKFLPLLGLSLLQTQVALYFMAFNYTLIYFSKRIFRYQLFAFLFTWAFYALFTGQYVLSGLLWGLTCLTCSYNGLRFGWVWLIMVLHNGFNKGYFLTFLVFLFMYFEFWIMPKILLYKDKKYHPSGPEGKLDIVNPFTFKQLLSPMYFPFNYEYYGKSGLTKSLNGWVNRVMGVWGIYPIHWISYPLFVVGVGMTIIGMLRSEFWLVGLTIILLLPSLDMKYRPRNSIMVIPIVAYFLAKGLING